MDISSIITATVSLTSPGISRLGFGEPCVFFYGPNTVPAVDPITDIERVRRYNSATALTAMVTDGFATTDPAYLAVASIVSQTPHPPTVKVARGGTAFTHDMELTAATFATGATLQFTMSKGAVTRTYTRTAGGVSLAAEATALALLMNNDASGFGTAGTVEVLIAGVGDNVEIDAISPANDGEMFYYSARTNIEINDVTADRGMATDLGIVAAADADWYALVLADAFGAIEIAAAAGWVAGQTNKTLCSGTQDTAVLGGAGIGNTLKGLNRRETYLIHSLHSMAEYPGGAAAGRFLPLDPGTESWCHKDVSGVTPSAYTAAQVTAMEADYVNMYTGIEIGGVSVVTGNLWKGWSSGSSETFIDTVRLIDALVVEVQTEVLTVLRTLDKVPFTDQGIGSIKGAILKAIKVFQPLGLEAGSEFVSIPLAADVSAVDKAARELPDVLFGATLAGGIVKVVITGQLSV